MNPFTHLRDLRTQRADARSWRKAARAPLGEVWTVVREARDAEGFPIVEVTVGPIVDVGPGFIELAGTTTVGDHAIYLPLIGRTRKALRGRGRYYAVRGDVRDAAPVDAHAGEVLMSLPDDLAVEAEFRFHAPELAGTRVHVTGLLRPVDPDEPAGRYVGDTWVSASEVTYVEQVQPEAVAS